MKKMFLISLILAAAVLSLSAEITDTDLLLRNSVSETLFPEQNYADFPSVLTNIQSTMMIPFVSMDGRINSVTAERNDDLIGLDGGTYESTELTSIQEIDYTSFFLLDSGSVFGFDGIINSDYSLNSGRDHYYSSASADTSATYYQLSLLIGSDFYLAFPIEETGSLGFKLGYNLSWDPAVFEYVEDYAGTSVQTYYNEYTTGGNSIDEYIHSINSSISYSVPVPDLDLNLGLNYTAYYDDRSNLYMPVDTDSDSYDETIQSAAAYYASLPGNEGYQYLNYSFYNNLDFCASAFLPISDKTAFVLSGTYTFIDYLYTYYAEHILDVATPTDASYNTNAYDAGLGSFEVLGAMDFKGEDKGTNLRVGLDYSRYAQNFSQDDMNTSGTSSTYSSANPGNLTELSLGASPSDDALSDDNGLTPVTEIIHRLGLTARYQTSPADKVTLLIDMAVSAFYRENFYQAFNTDTSSVWKEVDTSDGLNWNIGSYCGISLPVGEDWLCTFGVNSEITTGDLSIEEETLPYLIPDGTVTNDSSDKDGSLDLEFSFSLKFVYSI